MNAFLSYWVIKNSRLFLCDKLYVELLFYLLNGKRLNFSNPKTYCEKLNWLKLYDRNPDYTIMVDKVKAKEWVSQRIGSQYIIPTIGVWENPEDIDFEELPNRFVLKCNHNSGVGMFICKDKTKMNKKAVIKELHAGLNENYFLKYREWPYKNVPRRILAEQFMEDEENSELMDYKFFCFNGKPYMMYISQDHSLHPTTDFYDMNFNHLPLRMKDPNGSVDYNKPKGFEEMYKIAAVLSEGIPHLRVDFYVINNRVYFGELTFFPNAGFTEIKPEEWSLKIGEMIDLPKKKV